MHVYFYAARAHTHAHHATPRAGPSRPTGRLRVRCAALRSLADMHAPRTRTRTRLCRWTARRGGRGSLRGRTRCLRSLCAVCCVACCARCRRPGRPSLFHPPPANHRICTFIARASLTAPQRSPHSSSSSSGTQPFDSLKIFLHRLASRAPARQQITIYFAVHASALRFRFPVVAPVVAGSARVAVKVRHTRHTHLRAIFLQPDQCT